MNMTLDVTVLVLIGIVLTLALILSKLFFKPILALLQARKDHIATANKAEEDQKENVSRLVKEYEESILEAKQNAIQIREDIRSEGLQRERDLLDAAHKEHADAIHEAKQKARAELEEAKKEIDAHVKSLSVNVAEKILQRKV